MGDMFSVLFPTTAAQLNRIEQGVIALTSSIDQVRADYKAYAQDLKSQRDAAIALAEQYAATAQENADALAQFQADDAATDAAQLAEKEAADAAAFQADLDELKSADEPVEPEPEEPASE
jgi:hypothetical protein